MFIILSQAHDIHLHVHKALVRRRYYAQIIRNAVVHLVFTILVHTTYHLKREIYYPMHTRYLVHTTYYILHTPCRIISRTYHYTSVLYFHTTRFLIGC